MIKSTPIQRAGELSSQEFVTQFVNTNTPVVLTKITEQWPAREKWNTDYFKKTVGETVVPVYSSKPATGNDKQDAAALHLSITDYLTRLENGENDLRMFFYNILSGAPALTKDFSYPDCGLKFFKKLPVLFVGGKGAKVQMHFDIDLANILLCHFGGKKRVLLFSPDQTQYMYRVPYSFSSLHKIDFSNPDTNEYPALKKLNGLTAELEHGDVLYIPSGYWHYIIYEEIGYSLSLRAYPAGLKHKVELLKNVAYLHNVESVMRKIVGQSWVERNERLAVSNTHKALEESV